MILITTKNDISGPVLSERCQAAIHRYFRLFSPIIILRKSSKFNLYQPILAERFQFPLYLTIQIL